MNSQIIKHEFKLPSLLSPYTCFWEGSTEHVRCWFKKKYCYVLEVVLGEEGRKRLREKESNTETKLCEQKVYHNGPSN